VLEDRTQDVEMFSREVSGSAATLTQALASISWETRQSLGRLDASASDHIETTRLKVLARLDGFVGHTASRHAERHTRQAVVTIIERDVEAWRAAQLTTVHDSLSSLIDGQQEHLNRVADYVSAAAQRLLGAEVRPVIEPLPVPDAGGFRFDFSPEVGWNTSVVEGVRHHLPTRLRRRAVAKHLHAEAITLVDRQYGRARSDLQRRLEAAHRELARDVAKRVAEQRDALTSALTAATELRASTVEQQQSHLAQLDARLDALHQLVRPPLVEFVENGSES
jgi:predicted nucleic acid-binding protein